MVVDTSIPDSIIPVNQRKLSSRRDLRAFQAIPSGGYSESVRGNGTANGVFGGFILEIPGLWIRSRNGSCPRADSPAKPRQTRRQRHCYIRVRHSGPLFGERCGANCHDASISILFDARRLDSVAHMASAVFHNDRAVTVERVVVPE